LPQKKLRCNCPLDFGIEVERMLALRHSEPAMSSWSSVMKMLTGKTTGDYRKGVIEYIFPVL
jgi:hypothetical protein